MPIELLSPVELMVGRLLSEANPTQYIDMRLRNLARPVEAGWNSRMADKQDCIAWIDCDERITNKRDG